MNRLGGRTNTGEGGEDSDRYTPDANGDSRRSAVKQVASGRFGVTSEYLVNADDIQIKIAQGAKPGEGGQLPGSKVYPWIAKTRVLHPGRRADLAAAAPRHLLDRGHQAAHPRPQERQPAGAHPRQAGQRRSASARSRPGVAKALLRRRAHLRARRRHRRLAAVARSSTRAAPWELGLAETQQTLLVNGLRDRIVVQTDGQLKTGRDVVIAALLGAEEFGFATAPLVVSGCIMMRVCHLDTCPVGVATQNPELRKRFDGRPEYVVNFMRFIAQEVREYLAELGFRSHRGGRRARRGARHRRRRAALEDRGAGPARRSSTSPSCPPGTSRHRTTSAGPRPGEGAGQHADPALRGRAVARATRCAWTCRCATSTARSAPCSATS